MGQEEPALGAGAGSAPDVVATYLVTTQDTASALGSGDVPVLATPRLLAWCEAVTVTAAAAGLPAGATTVGTRVALEHLRATPVGGRVTVWARVVDRDDRSVRLVVGADDGGVPVGRGEVVRAVVDRERFLSRLG